MSDKAYSWEGAVNWLKQQPEHQDIVQACFYDDPLISAAERYFNSTEWQAVREFYPATLGKVLDLGAGRGIASYALARDGWEVTAIEPNTSPSVGSGAIRQLASDAKLSINIEESWGEVLPFTDNTFDMVHARQVLHHAHDLKKLCKEASRVLKPGGIFIATREHVISKLSDLPKFLEIHPLHNLYGGENAYLVEQYIDAISNAGIKLQKVLNPYQSDINLYPDTVDALRRRIAKNYQIPAWAIPSVLLSIRGLLNNQPGRLFSFVGYKSSV